MPGVPEGAIGKNISCLEHIGIRQDNHRILSTTLCCFAQAPVAAVKVDQAGYLPNAPKIAVVTAILVTPAQIFFGDGSGIAVFRAPMRSMACTAGVALGSTPPLIVASVNMHGGSHHGQAGGATCDAGARRDLRGRGGGEDTAMSIPPLSMWLTVDRPDGRPIRLWLPLFLIWLLLLPFLVIVPSLPFRFSFPAIPKADFAAALLSLLATIAASGICSIKPAPKVGVGMRKVRFRAAAVAGLKSA